MFSELLESISTQTILPLKRPSVSAEDPPEKRQKTRALLLGFAPLSGVIFGLIGAGIIWWLHSDVSILASWIVPILWFFLSGAQPFSSLCRSTGAMFAKTKSSAVEILSRESFTGLGMAVGVMLISGEFFALIQGAAIPRARLGAIVFLVPVIARVAAAIFGCSAWGRSEDSGFGSYRFTAFANAAFIGVLALAASVELAVLLFVAGLLASIFFGALLHARSGLIPASSFGALVVMNEIIGLWVGVVYLLL